MENRKTFIDYFVHELQYLKDCDPLRIGQNGLTVPEFEAFGRSVEKCSSKKVVRRFLPSGLSKLTISDKQKTALEKTGSVCVTGLGTVRKIETGYSVTRTMSVHRCAKGKFCSVCADAEYMRRMRALNDWYKANTEQIDSAYMVTFTQRKNPGETSGEAVQRILSAFRNFQRIGQKNRAGEYSKIVGGFRSVECEYTPDGWHAHIHAVVFCSSELDYQMYLPGVKRAIRKDCGYLPIDRFRAEVEKRGGYLHEHKQSTLSAEWQRCAEGAPGVRADPIFGGKGKPKNLFDRLKSSEKNSKTELAKRIRYSMKYSLKDNDFSALPLGRLFELVDGFNGVRKHEFLGGVGAYMPETAEQFQPDTAQTIFEEMETGGEWQVSEKQKLLFEDFGYKRKETARENQRQVVRFLAVKKFSFRAFQLLKNCENIDYTAECVRYIETLKTARKEMRKSIATAEKVLHDFIATVQRQIEKSRRFKAELPALGFLHYLKKVNADLLQTRRTEKENRRKDFLRFGVIADTLNPAPVISAEERASRYESEMFYQKRDYERFLERSGWWKTESGAVVELCF